MYYNMAADDRKRLTGIAALWWVANTVCIRGNANCNQMRKPHFQLQARNSLRDGIGNGNRKWNTGHEQRWKWEIGWEWKRKTGTGSIYNPWLTKTATKL